MSLHRLVRRIVAGATCSVLLLSLVAHNGPSAHADAPVEVLATGTVQVMAIDGPDGSSSIASVIVAGVSLPISDADQAAGLYSGDQVSLTVDVAAVVLDNLSAADQAALASQPVVDGVTKVDGSSELGASLLTQTVAVTAAPQITWLTVDASPATEPLTAPQGTASFLPNAGPVIGGTAITPLALNQTIHLAIAFAGSYATPWISDADAVDYIAQAQAWYRQYTGMNFTFIVSAVAHLTNAVATVCGDGNAAQAEMNKASLLFGRANLDTYVNPDRIHLVVLEDMTSCSSAAFTGIGTVSYPSASIPGYNAGGATLIRISQNTSINGGPLYSIRAIAHELGHNFGFNHSNTLMCSSAGGTATWNQGDAGSCANLEYGDLFDLMGHHQYPGALGSTRKYQSGLLSSTAITTINSAVTNQSVTLTMLPTGDDASPQLLYIADSVPVAGSKDAALVAGLPYTVELRLPSNMNGTLSSALGGPGFVVLRANRTQTWMLQPTVPGLNTNAPPLTLNKELTAGATFASPDGLISFTVVSVPLATCSTSCTGEISVTRMEPPTPMYRIFNTTTGEHFYTSSPREARANVNTGAWKYEGIGWFAPLSGDPVYRLAAIPGSGSAGHLFTTSAKERDTALASRNPMGKPYWKCETGTGMPSCVGWYSGGTKPVFRAFYPGNGQHNYTTDANEQHVITGSGPQGGWNDEKIGWYGLLPGNPLGVLP